MKKEEKKKGRPRVLSDEERRERRNAYQRKWRAMHPYTWDRIWRKSLAKRRAEELAEMKLDLSKLDPSL